jgi:hypothetical protein
VSELPNDQTLQLVRSRVQSVLGRSPSFRSLPPDQRRALAHDMVKVARYMVDAGGETAGVPMRAVMATGLADRAQQTANTPDGETAGQKFGKGGAVAAQQGSAAFTDTIRRVNFPRFVAGLVDGVFNAIVRSSIQQMEAYGTLVSNIAKSVDEYMRDNISENQARDFLAAKYPQHLAVDTKARGGPKLMPAKPKPRLAGAGGRGGRAMALADAGPQSQLPDFMKDLGLPAPVTHLDAKTAEDTLVPAARRRMAMDRQQLLATMVLMGINRLIVTDGKISASCMFTLDTTDSVGDTTSRASSFDEHTEENKSGWSFLWWSSPEQKKSADFHVSTNQDTDSSAEVNMHAQLGGNVEINFRSETFPLDRMADILQIKEIEDKAPAAAVPVTQRPGMQLPPPPALPPMPGFPGAQPAPAPARQPAATPETP